MKIIIIGLGPGGMDHMSQKSMEIIDSGSKIYLRTIKHPAAEELKAKGYVFNTFDHLYEQAQTFEEVYSGIVGALIDTVKKYRETIVYGVPGNPLVAEKTVRMLLDKAKFENIPVEVIGASSGLEAIYTSLQIDPCEGLIVLDALDFDAKVLKNNLPILFTQVYNTFIASELKLTLMDYFNEEHRVKVIKHAGMNDERIEEIYLYELDRLHWIDHLTSLYVPSREDKVENNDFSLSPLMEVMEKLRGPDGCPWDRKQNHASLKKYVLEETYEVLEAIDEGNMNKLREELGDLLLQVVFHSLIAAENNIFNINDVINEITEKLVRRHPHVFGDVNVDSAEEVQVNWEKIKKAEKEQNKVLSGVPKVFPALMRAEKLQKKAAAVGFDWPDITGAVEKVKEELEEFIEANKINNFEKMKEEMGDIFFALVNVCRFLEINPEEALQSTNAKFIRRFEYIEEQIKKKNLQWNELNLQYMDMLWDEAKNKQEFW